MHSSPVLMFFLKVSSFVVHKVVATTFVEDLSLLW